MFLKIIYCPYYDLTQYTVKFTLLPSGVPLGTPSDVGVYSTVYPSSRPNTDTLGM